LLVFVALLRVDETMKVIGFVTWLALLSVRGVGAKPSASTGAKVPPKPTIEADMTVTKVTEAVTPKPPSDSLQKSKTVNEVVPRPMGFRNRPAVDYGLRYSSNDWFINFISTPTSFILRRIRYQLIAQAAICLAVIYFYPKHPGLSIPLTGHSLVSASLGLLMSYRTNSAYARFWEARGHWTSIKATCRNLALMVKSHIAPHSPVAAQHFLKLLAAYPATLMYLCLGGSIKMPDIAQKFLPIGRTSEYQEHPALPAMDLCLQMHQTLHEAVLESTTAKVDLVEAAHINEVTHMVDTLLTKTSCCEKILRTPVPWTYSRHTSRFLTLWIGTLPFALIGTLPRWITLCVTMSASYCMLGIEEIGHLIEQPFLGDAAEGEDQIWGLVDKDGEASPLIQRGLSTQPYDIGIPVCSLAAQIREEVERIAAMPVASNH